ncbi:nuclear transport factor 2 family protein [Amycolatopsis silviterrae]|uniref:Nuclear transport factor 2 family protein n=1 Tax=Amycolatopsis silviterrae TaxID=1656914 RepID=A0ABW5HKE9_9PSEU
MGDNKTTCREFLLAMGNGDIDGVKARATEDIVFTTKGSSMFSAARTLPELLELIGTLDQLTASEFTAEFPSMTAEDDRVSVEMAGHADLVGGGRYDNIYHFLFRFRGDKIASVEEYLDTKYTEAAILPALSALSEQAGAPAE